MLKSLAVSINRLEHRSGSRSSPPAVNLSWLQLFTGSYKVKAQSPGLEPLQANIKKFPAVPVRLVAQLLETLLSSAPSTPISIPLLHFVHSLDSRSLPFSESPASRVKRNVLQRPALHDKLSFIAAL